MVGVGKMAKLCSNGMTNFVLISCRLFSTSLNKQIAFKAGITNPLDDIRTVIQVPVLREEDVSFQPDYSSVEKIQKLFQSSRLTPLSTMKGVAHYANLPQLKYPEVAFVGRSNVGKSSLIKALFFNPQGVRISVSKSAGHTTVLKMYSLGRLFSLVDMPGYGYNMPKYYQDCVEEYLKQRRNLCRTFLLMDGAAGITDTDKIGIEMMEEFNKPYTVVFTKIDKNSLHKTYLLLENFHNYRTEHMPGCLPQPFLVSLSVVKEVTSVLKEEDDTIGDNLPPLPSLNIPSTLKLFLNLNRTIKTKF